MGTVYYVPNFELVVSLKTHKLGTKTHILYE